MDKLALLEREQAFWVWRQSQEARAGQHRAPLTQWEHWLGYQVWRRHSSVGQWQAALRIDLELILLTYSFGEPRQLR